MIMLLTRIKYIVKNPRGKFLRILNKYARLIKSDSLYLKVRYRIVTGLKLNLRDPKGFCEKLQWLKINDRNYRYPDLVDKFLVKDIVAKLIGSQYVVANLGVWKDADEIDFSALPERFVLKTTHAAGSSGVIICRNIKDLDIEDVKYKLNQSLRLNPYYITREWPYKNIVPRIIAEQYLEDETGELKDYKVMCFNGEPRLIQVHLGRFYGLHTQDFYDVDWNKLENLNQEGCITSDIFTPKPSCLSEMLLLSKKLSKDIPHVRVDWYVVDDRLYFGEMTFYDASGYDVFIPFSKELEIGSWISLPQIKHEI